MLNLRKYIIYSFTSVWIILLTSSIILNCFGKQDNYFCVPLYHLFNMGTLLVITNILSKKESNFEKKKKLMENLINLSIELLYAQEMFSAGTVEAIQIVSMNKREINNHLDLMQKFEKDFDIKDEISEIKKFLDDYWNCISEHIDDIEYLGKTRNELYKYISNIKQRFLKLNLKIYGIE